MARRGSTTTVTIREAVSVKATEIRPPAQVKMRTVVLITRAVQTRVRSAVIQPGTSAPEGGRPSAEEKVLLVAMRYPEEKRVKINVVHRLTARRNPREYRASNISAMLTAWSRCQRRATSRP